MTTYKEVKEWMFENLKRYQSIGAAALNPGLGNIQGFAELLNHPEKKFKSIHVGGTNGKGSTSHMLSSILQEAGYKVGLYTSPHLKEFTERIRINGQEIEQQFVVDFALKYEDFIQEQRLSFFELTVGMAFNYFADQKVDIAIIEVGMGGRFDATNIILPELSVITNIGFDHMKFLGNTLPKIAFEKAGIIKPNVSVVIGERQEETTNVFIQKCKEVNAEIVFASDNHALYESDLKGSYQEKNANTVVKAIQKLEGFSITSEHIEAGLLNVVKNTGLRGRWEILQEGPKVICDTAHNKEGLTYVMKQLQEEEFEKLFLIVGFVKDKKLETILDLFPQNAHYFFCKPDIDRGLDASELSAIASNYGLVGEVCDSVSEAYQLALQKANSKDLMFVGGSTFVVAEII